VPINQTCHRRPNRDSLLRLADEPFNGIAGYNIKPELYFFITVSISLKICDLDRGCNGCSVPLLVLSFKTAGTGGSTQVVKGTAGYCDGDLN
jgi:hypothetical protein